MSFFSQIDFDNITTDDAYVFMYGTLEPENLYSKSAAKTVVPCKVKILLSFVCKGLKK